MTPHSSTLFIKPFLMQIAYIFFYPYNLNMLGVTIGKNPDSGNHKFHFKNLSINEGGVDELSKRQFLISMILFYESSVK